MNSKTRQEITLAFRQNLEALMNARKLSVSDISDMAGVAKSVAHSWISGSIPQNLPAVARLAEALQMNFKTLLLGSDDRHSETTNILELQESTELFDGICHVTIRKLGTTKPPSF